MTFEEKVPYGTLPRSNAMEVIAVWREAQEDYKQHVREAIEWYEECANDQDWATRLPELRERLGL